MENIKQQNSNFNELGSLSVSHSSGYLTEELLRDLQGRKGIIKYKEMWENDATVGAIFNAIDFLIRRVTWRFEPSEKDTDKFYSDYIYTVFMEDMETPMQSVVSEAMSYLIFGFACIEKVYKLRKGRSTNKKFNSKYNDGLFGVRKLANRPQDSIEKWQFTKHGEILGFWQEPFINDYPNVFIPIEKVIHLRTRYWKNNPAGKSILRNAYKSYVYLSNIQAIEAIAIERELAGVPVIKIPNSFLTADDENARAVKNAYKKIAENLKMGKQSGVVLPSDTFTDQDGKISQVPMVSLELIASKGTRLISTNDTINRYQSDILKSVLADFLRLGDNERGSFALSKSKVSLFLNAIEVMLLEVTNGFNQVIDDLWELNGFDQSYKPVATADKIAPQDLTELSDYVKNLSAAGIGFDDKDSQIVLRRMAGLPEVENTIELPSPNIGNNNE